MAFYPTFSFPLFVENNAAIKNNLVHGKGKIFIQRLKR